MREAVIVSYARTGLAKSGRGGFNITAPMSMAANSIRSDGADCIVAGGVESISIPGGGSPKESIDPDLLKAAPDIFMAMIDTADIVAERYKLSREYQDEYSLESQRRMAAAQQAHKFKDEIVPMKTRMKVVDKATKAESIVDYVVDYVVDRDE